VITQDQLRDVVGATAYDGSGDKIGKIGNVYYDDNTDQPKWLTVHTGLFGGNETFVPLQGADVSGDRVTVAYDKATIKDAPNVDEEGHLSVEDEQRLYQYYSLDNTTDQVVDGRHSERDDVRNDDREGVFGGQQRGAVGRDTSGPSTDAAMTRSEEQLRVGTETREVGRARLRKHVVTEQQQATVGVSHDEVRVEREPITDANRGDALDGPSISEEEHEVVLREERPVVGTEAVAVERVRLDTDTVQDQETVSGEVRKEVVDVDDDVTRGDQGVTSTDRDRR
jgi:uncharacterized protein (TIGR02271 family)